MWRDIHPKVLVRVLFSPFKSSVFGLIDQEPIIKCQFPCSKRLVKVRTLYFKTCRRFDPHAYRVCLQIGFIFSKEWEKCVALLLEKRCRVIPQFVEERNDSNIIMKTQSNHSEGHSWFTNESLNYHRIRPWFEKNKNKSTVEPHERIWEHDVCFNGLQQAPEKYLQHNLLQTIFLQQKLAAEWCSSPSVDLAASLGVFLNLAFHLVPSKGSIEGGGIVGTSLSLL